MVPNEDKRRFVRRGEDAEIIYSIIPNYNKKERRRFIRIKEDDIISYAVIPKYKSTHSLTKDLSIGGIRFFCDRFIPPHSILKVEIRLKYIPRVITAIVRVVWIKEIFDDECYEAGTEFIEIEKKDSKFLNDYLFE